MSESHPATDEHCRDCCCARAWKALGITEYTGKSIPEHITELKAQHGDLLKALKELGDWVAAGLQASDEAWPDARCLQETERIGAKARAAVTRAEGRS